VKRALESVDGVGAVTLSGGSAREIHVVVDIEKLNARGLSIQQVRDAIQKENVEIPGGTIEQGAWEVGLRTMGRIEATSQFDNIIIATVGGVPVPRGRHRLTEDSVEKTANVLTLEDGSPAGAARDPARVGREHHPGDRGGQERLDTVRRALPAGRDADDQQRRLRGSSTRRSRRSRAPDLGQPLAAVVVDVLHAQPARRDHLGARHPGVDRGHVHAHARHGLHAQQHDAARLTLAVGIVIDDAIVVLENIFRYIEEKNCTPFEAAIQGTREVALPVMATTLSLIVIFLPVAFMTGYARRFIYPFGWTMAFAIASRCSSASRSTPMLSSRFLKLADAEKDLKTKDRGFFHWVDGAYARSLHWALAHPLAILGVTVLVLGLTIPLNRMIGRTFIPGGGHGRVHRAHRHAAGHLARRHQEIAEQVVKEIGGRRAWRASRISPAPTA
jgi:HAE1 family hydrophobic/amphiphilic exporter-1